MGTCESCARWAPFDYTDCVNPPAVPCGWCESPDPRVPESGSHGPLRTRADFGCVAHEVKSAAEAEADSIVLPVRDADGVIRPYRFTGLRLLSVTRA